jgi:uncharacterized protein
MTQTLVHRAIIPKALAVVRPQFRLRYTDGIHGLPHWSRVWFHGRALARAMDVNPAVLAWFAFLHDSQREHDGYDRLHGSLAADFAIRLRHERVITELAPTEFEHLCEAMRLHSDGHTEGEPALRACWDADRLDLGRVGITPNPRYLCTPHGKRALHIEAAVRMSEGSARRLA